MPHTEIRPAQAQDKDTVLAFCQNTWDWGDYIDRVWDDWLVDPQGKLFVAVTDGRPSGVTHLRMINETDAWLEGLRVDPSYRHQGIAVQLHMAMIEEALRRGATNARLTTESTNTGAIHIMGQVSMRRVGAFAPFRAYPVTTQVQSHTKISYQPESTQLASVEDLDEIIDYLNVSNVFPIVGGLYYVGFVAYEITAMWLERYITAQNVYLLRRWGRIDGVAIAEARHDRQGKRLSIGYIDGMTIEATSLIAYDLRNRLTTLELEGAYVYAPDLMLIRDGLAGMEYESDEKVFYTYERGLV